MHKLIAALVLASTIASPAFCQKASDDQADSHKDRELKACGPREKEVKYVADTDKKTHPLGTETTGTALIYVIRSTMYGNKVQTKLAVDGEWKGVNRGNNYFFFNLSPGEHYFCSQSENRSIAVIKIEAGKTYYLDQSIHMGAIKARNDLNVMDDDQGRMRLEKAHPSTWEVR